MNQIIICPGIHSPKLTENFVTEIGAEILNNPAIFPSAESLAYSPWHIWQWLQQDLNLSPQTTSLTFITFSAGVVGGILTALAWQHRGGKIAQFIAVDGWGVPLVVDFPIHRLSHDYFTHWSSSLLGGGKSGFYCDPPVPHLDLWQFPRSSWGWQTIRSGDRRPNSAAKYIRNLLA